MDKKGWMMLRVLINRYNPKTADAVLKLLPPEDKQALAEISIKSNDIMPMLQLPDKSLEKIHYSWIKPVLEKLPQPFQNALMASLTPEQRGGLHGPVKARVSNPVKMFMLRQLGKRMHIADHLPVEYLPVNELQPLIKWKKKQLVDLANFLGLYDLATEVRHIVNRDHLNNIYQGLTPLQLQYLKICMHQKQKIVSPKLGIDLSKRDDARLKHVLQRRGLARLSKALCGQHPDLVWYLAHTLDAGRGKALLKDFQPQALPEITQVLKQQVMNLMNFLKSE